MFDFLSLLPFLILSQGLIFLLFPVLLSIPVNDIRI
jgi:hypothetical protein